MLSLCLTLWYTTKSRDSEQTSFCVGYSEQSLNITENSEHYLKFWTLLNILNRFWKFWTYSEHYWIFWTDSKHYLKFWTDSGHYWKFWTDSEHYWKFWTDSEHYWKFWTASEHGLNRVCPWTFSFFLSQYILLHFH
jgi:hypothetical protein